MRRPRADGRPSRRVARASSMPLRLAAPVLDRLAHERVVLEERRRSVGPVELVFPRCGIFVCKRPHRGKGKQQACNLCPHVVNDTIRTTPRQGRGGSIRRVSPCTCARLQTATSSRRQTASQTQVFPQSGSSIRQVRLWIGHKLVDGGSKKVSLDIIDM